MVDLTEFKYRGSIVRIRIRNFMTYTEAEFMPGPNLNIILGPNGTGKSALVCCIIVGLAGEVSLTGRGSTVADFVKKDCDEAFTEIELFNNKGKNFIVERTIQVTGRSKFKNDTKSDWKINGKAKRKSDVQALTSELHIKVDNLCQFLPQDSVTQFVKMNTIELLTNTLKAAGDDKLVEDHQQLITITKEVADSRHLLKNLQISYQEIEVNAKRLESEVHLLRQRESLIKEKNTCVQKMFYLKYIESKKTRKEFKVHRNKMIEELQALEANNEPCKRAVETRKAQELRYYQQAEISNKDLCKTHDLIQSAKNDIENRKVDCQDEFSKFKGKQDQEKHREQSIRLKRQEIESYQCKLDEMEYIDCTDQIKSVEIDMQVIKEERLNNNRERSSLENHLKEEVIPRLDLLKREKNQILAVKDKKIQILRSRNKDAFTVLDWLQKNRARFQSQIFLPIMTEINVKEPKYNKIIENAIPRQELFSFVCQTKEDLQSFTRAARDELRVKINVVLIPEKSIRQYEQDASRIPDLKPLGVKAFLKDLIDAPEPIMRYLCGNHNFHRIAVADECTEVQLQQLLGKLNKFYVRDTCYHVATSRYDGQKITTSEVIRDSNLLQFCLDTVKLKQCERDYVSLSTEHDSTKKKLDEVLSKGDEFKEKWQKTLEKHRELSTKHEEKRKLETLISRSHELISRLEDDKIDIEAERRKLQQSIVKINQDILNHLSNLVKVQKDSVNLKKNRMINLMRYKLSIFNHRAAKKKLTSAQKESVRIKDELKRAEQTMKVYDLQLDTTRKTAEEKIPGFRNGELNPGTKKKFSKIELETIAALKDKIDDLEIRIQRISKDNSLLHEFERQNQELKSKKDRIAELETFLKDKESSRQIIKDDWLPKLKKVIEAINKNYQDFMRKLRYDGEVKLDYNPADLDNFSSYGIMILVKYRDSDQLIPLSSTRQSGGERSVATMIYMLALQTKTTVPFRCVDEINQGMDKENERKVFELLVHTADSSSSQYFLVSPKLLKNLPFSDKMRAHVVHNGSKLEWRGSWPVNR